MKTIHAKIPDYLAKLAKEAAEKEDVSVDQIVALALSAQVTAWNVRDDIETRAKRGKLEDFDRVLAKVPAIEPEEGDRL